MKTQNPQPEEPDSSTNSTKWFDWRDLFMPILPSIVVLALFFYTWHPLFLVSGLLFLIMEGVLISWRLGKLQ